MLENEHWKGKHWLHLSVQFLINRNNSWAKLIYGNDWRRLHVEI